LGDTRKTGVNKKRVGGQRNEENSRLGKEKRLGTGGVKGQIWRDAAFRRKKMRSKPTNNGGKKKGVHPSTNSNRLSG